MNRPIQGQLTTYAKNCVQPGLDYFNHQLSTSLKIPLLAFKAARLFCPHRVGFFRPTATDIDELHHFPFSAEPDVLSSLKADLPSYLARAEGTNADVNHLDWWKQSAVVLPHWATIARKVLAVQPSSAAAERAFSLLNSGFSDQQDNSLQDYIEASVMLRFNHITPVDDR